MYALGLPTDPSLTIRPPPLVPPPAPTTNPLEGFPAISNPLLAVHGPADRLQLFDPNRPFPQRNQKRQIIDIAPWVQLYCTYILILSSRHPQVLPELIPYQLFIVKAAKIKTKKKFRYPSWLYYDTEFRKWAATTHRQEWSTINTQLYSLAFTGQGNPVSWCQVDGGNHTFDCPRYPIPTVSPPAPNATRPQMHCINYNTFSGNCKYGLSCRYPSVCGVHGHPGTRCPNRSHQLLSVAPACTIICCVSHYASLLLH